MTKSKWALSAATVVFLLASLLPALGQRSGGYRTNARRYDPATEVTVKGTVEEVKQQTGRHSWNGTHLTLKTDTETLDVHVGPSWFLTQKEFPLAKGDEVEITGSKVTIGTGTAVVAREVRKDGKTLTLRDSKGVPQWSRRAGA
jgi:DNA/RNA endonuclease YhcR with UshA esterase domain